MGIPVLPSKYAVPATPSFLLGRKRLDVRWESWKRKRVVMVTAGAGFGKTSFLAGNASRSTRPVVWLTLDEYDVETQVLAAHLVHAFRRLSDGDAHTLPDERDLLPQRLLPFLVRTLRDRGEGVVLVLDDVHLLRGHAGPLSYLDRLLRNLPDTSTVVLSSREPLGISSMKPRVHGSADSLTATDFEFTDEEIGELFRLHYPDGLLSERLRHRIRQSTEGWAAGVEILFQALRDPSEQEVEQTLDRLSEAGSGWFSYFAEEVLSRLNATTRDFLLASSVLPNLDPAICNLVLGIDTSAAVLNGLCERNLFTFRIGEKRGGFRYHRLFREFLQEQLRQATPGRKLSSLHRRAAKALEKSGDYTGALTAFAEAGAYTDALRLVRNRRDELLTAGRYAPLERALGLLPEDLIRSSFPAMLFLGLIHDGTGRWKAAMRSYKAAWNLAQAGSERAGLLAMMAVLHLRWGEYAKCRELCAQALNEPGGGSPDTIAPIQEMLGIAASELGFFDEAESQIEEARSNWRKAGNLVQEAHATAILAANAHAPRGDFRKARSLANDAAAAQSGLGDERYECHALSVLALLAAATLDEQEARSTARRALRLAEKLEYTMMVGVCRHVLGVCAWLAGNMVEARTQFEASLRLADEIGETELGMIPRLGLAQVELDSGNPLAALRHAHEVLERAVATGDRLQEVQSLMIMGSIEESRSAAIPAASGQSGVSSRAHPAPGPLRGSGKAAVPLRYLQHWRKAEKTARAIGARFELHRALLCRLHRDDIPDADIDTRLDELLSGSALLEHERLFTVLEPDRAARVLTEALRRGIGASYALRILVNLGERAVRPLSELASDCSESVRPTVVKALGQIGGTDAATVLARIARTSTRSARLAREAATRLGRRSRVPLKIRALGPLRITIGDRELVYDGWNSSRALRLFQFLLVHRFRWIPREQILEVMWPGTDESRAGNNLRQTLHLLRGTLEPDLGTAAHSSYVPSRVEACRLEPGPGYSYDVEEFEAVLGEAAEHRRSGTPAKALRCYEQALCIYTGEFLAETPYVEFASGEREHLRERLLGALEEMLQLYNGAGRWNEAIRISRMGLGQDPYRDAFHYSLIQAQFRLGNRREALADYHRYEEGMMTEMNLLPDPAIRSLADRIISWGRRR